MEVNKIGLGTVQFGMDYGINNPVGKVPAAGVKEILELAAAAGIDTLDTSSAYGDSEEVLGKLLPGLNREFKLISKIPRTAGSAREAFHASLKNLGTDHLYGYLVHHFELFLERPEVYDQLIALRESGQVERIGFSLYKPSELTYLFNKKVPFSLVQLPYNIFDRRFAPYFKELKERGVEIHIRSVFLQGLVFRSADTLSPFFDPVKTRLVRLHQLAKSRNTSIHDICLNFVIKNEWIDKVIVGVDKKSDLEKNIRSIQAAGSEEPDQEIVQLEMENEEVLLPQNWKL